MSSNKSWLVSTILLRQSCAMHLGQGAGVLKQSCAMLLGQEAGVLRDLRLRYFHSPVPCSWGRGRGTEANSTAFLSTSVLGEATADNTEWNGFFRPGSS